MTYAQTIRNELTARGWTVKRFADEIGRSPEHARKVRDGTAFPGPELTKQIAMTLDLKLDEFEEQVDVARWEKNRGRKPPKSERPDIGPLEGVWRELSDDQRDYVLCVANCLTMKKVRALKAR